MEQPRVQPGVTEAGRFASPRIPDSAVSLLPKTDEEHNAEGTYEYPPPVRSYEQMVAFWTHVQVPDLVLRQMQAGYSTMRMDDIGPEIDRWLDANPEPPLTDVQRHAEWKERGVAAEEEMYGGQPKLIPAATARSLARAALMHRQALEAETRQPEALAGLTDRVLDETYMDLGACQPVKVAEMLERYPVDRLGELTWIDKSSESLDVILGTLQDMMDRAHHDPA